MLSPALVDGVLYRFEELVTEREASGLGLSKPELEILRLLSQGATNKAIADTIFCSEATVKRRIGDILSTLGVSNRAQAVAEAMKRGLI